MKSIIIYASVHHKNTEKIARAIGKELNSEIIEVSNLKKFDVSDYDLIGFGSGIYMGNFSSLLFSAIDKIKGLSGKNIFLFSTSGMRENFINKFSKKIKKILTEKECVVVGEFNCLGFDTFGPMGLIGGLNKGSPNEEEVNEAVFFAKKIRNI